ncbi:MAG TPA: hypothetical protein VK582_11770 [Pyrinomonadaceae bacterium]|nr:hypothetical protein [Pyrinomonadaceae bacterium]
MIRASLLIPIFLVLLPTAVAQPGEATKTTAKTTAANNKSAKDLEAERILRERRANAQSLLISLAVDARNFSDQALRARTQARIADALWEVDRERGRAMFRAAWDAAEIADQEGQERLQEDIRQQRSKNGGGGYAVASPPEIRKEVLRLAAKRDRALGEEILAKFKEQKAAEAKSTRPNPLVGDEAIGQRLALAQQLLEAGDTERALQFADPVLGGANMQSIEFLTALRDKDATAADQRYAALLANAPANPQSDANTVSMLSSYIFTPHMYVAFQGTGVSSSQMTRPAGPANVPAELRAAFFRSAASILLRPLAPPGQDQTTSGPDGQYMIIKRLMPLFEQGAPPEMTTALKAQLEALTTIASSSARDRDEEWVHRGIGPEKPAVDREQALLDQIDHAKTAAERDRLNLRMAMLLSDKGDLRARDYAGKIDDTDMRNSARAFLDSAMAMQAVEKKDIDRALEIVKAGELTHIQRVWLLAQTAKLVVKTDRDKALMLVDDAATEARRIDGSDPDRARAFFAVTNAMLLINRLTAWDSTSEAVKASNSAETFTGEDGQLTFRLNTKGMNSVYQNSIPDFDVAGLFSELAKEDYEKAVELARGFEHEAPRANAVIAIARSVLEEKKK